MISELAIVATVIFVAEKPRRAILKYLKGKKNRFIEYMNEPVIPTFRVVENSQSKFGVQKRAGSPDYWYTFNGKYYSDISKFRVSDYCVFNTVEEANNIIQKTKDDIWEQHRKEKLKVVKVITS